MRFFGQMFPSVGGFVGGWFHMGWGSLFGCHSVVDLSVEADGCPEAGDFSCDSGVDFWTIEADGCPGAGDFACHLAVDLGCHWGGGCSVVGVDGSPGAGGFGLVRAFDSSGNLGIAFGVPLLPGWTSNAMWPTIPWWPLLCSVSLDPIENLGSASGVPLHPVWSNDAVQPTSSWWPSLLRSSGGKSAV